MSNCNGASCKCKKRHGTKRKRRRDSYIKSSRPFAPEYSTSTISKAINLVYGKPELPNMSKYQDLPGTTHFNIFHRTGVPNGNDVLGHIVDYQQNAIPNNHGVSPGSDESAHTGHNPDTIHTNMTYNENTPGIDVIEEGLPVRVLDYNLEMQQNSPLTSREQVLSPTTSDNTISGENEPGESSGNEILEGNAGNNDEELRTPPVQNPVDIAIQSATNNSHPAPDGNIETPPMSQSMANVPPENSISNLPQRIVEAYNDVRGSDLPKVGPNTEAALTKLREKGVSPAQVRAGSKTPTPKGEVRVKRKTTRPNAGLPGRGFSSPGHDGPQSSKRYVKGTGRGKFPGNR